MTQPITIIIFGATGDLMRRKLAPALVRLAQSGALAPGSSIIAIGRRDFTTETYTQFLAETANGSGERIGSLPLHYFKGDIASPEGLRGLGEFVRGHEQQRVSMRIFYLATSYEFFPPIITTLAQEALSNGDVPRRIAFEKPFGDSNESCKKIDESLHTIFSEEDIFRVDHYLAKESVQNILALRFSNPVFEELLRGDVVERIELVVDEKIGVEGRFVYYEQAGALRDMIQNHLLQVLSLVLMERPRTLHANAVHDAKVGALRHLTLAGTQEHLLGQYTSYAAEAATEGQQVSATTETFARITLYSETTRWKHVPIILRTGKSLGQKYGQIRVIFKNQLTTLGAAFVGAKKNALLIDLHPKQDVRLVLNSRKPGTAQEVVPIPMEFCHDCHFGPNTIDEYVTLISEIISGEKMLFARSDEVAEGWRIVDALEGMREKITFVQYEPGTDPEIH